MPVGTEPGVHLIGSCTWSITLGAMATGATPGGVDAATVCTVMSVAVTRTRR